MSSTTAKRVALGSIFTFVGRSRFSCGAIFVCVTYFTGAGAGVIPTPVPWSEYTKDEIAVQENGILDNDDVEKEGAEGGIAQIGDKAQHAKVSRQRATCP